MGIGYVCAVCQISESSMDMPRYTANKEITPALLSMVEEATAIEAMAWEETTWRSVSYYIKYILNWARRCEHPTEWVLPITSYGARQLFQYAWREGRSWSFAQGLRWALTAWHEMGNKPDPFEDKKLCRFYNGLHKVMPTVVQPALPIRISWIRKIRAWSYAHSNTSIAHRDSSAAELSFFGIRRMSEIVIPKSGRTGLRIGDVVVVNKIVNIHVRGTKVDKFNKGADYQITAKTSSGIDIGYDVSGLQRILEEQGFDTDAPLIQGTRGMRDGSDQLQFSGQPLKNWNDRFKKLLKWAVGLDDKTLRRYSSHSLRRGGCSHAFNSGAGVEAIMALGAWSARASFDLYRFLSPKEMVKITKAM